MTRDPGTLLLAAAGAIAVLLLASVAALLVIRGQAVQRRVDRVAGTARSGRGASGGADDPRRRRLAVEERLKEMAEADRQRARKSNAVSLKTALQQAGLTITVRQFLVVSLCLGLVAFSLAIALGTAPLVAAAAALLVGFVLPRGYLRLRRKRILRKFLNEFPVSLDVIVRGVRSGLPLTECLEVIAQEARPPVAAEFRRAVEDQMLGISIPNSINRLADRVPLTEIRFFATVLNMQSKTGGNLSEALGNLSEVIREQIKLQSKIKALSAEAKASGIIIGSMPVVVGALVYLTSPDYISLLFTTGTGKMVMACSATWMLMGVLVMRQMIAFKV